MKNENAKVGLRISDHAKVRFAERVKGMNFNEFEKYILDKKVINAIGTLGSGEFPLENGYRIVVVNNVVVTVK